MNAPSSRGSKQAVSAGKPKQISVLGFAVFMFRRHGREVALLSPLILMAGVLDAGGIT